MKNIIFKSFVFTASLFPILVIPFQATYAAEWHQTPGSGCKAWHQASAGNLTIPIGTAYLKATANSTWVVCPQTNHGNQGGWANRTHHIITLNHATNHATTCSVWNGTFSGGSFTIAPSKTFIGNNYISLNNLNATTWGNTSIVCLLKDGDTVRMTASYN